MQIINGLVEDLPQLHGEQLLEVKPRVLVDDRNDILAHAWVAGAAEDARLEASFLGAEPLDSMVLEFLGELPRQCGYSLDC